MIKSVIAVFWISVLSSPLAFAQSQEFDSSFVHEGFLKLKTSLHTLASQNLKQDKSCPDGGVEVSPNVNSVQDSMMSSANTIDQLMESLRPLSAEKQATNNKCGQCQQHNMVSSVASISPVRTSTNDFCNNKPTETFNIDVQSKSEIKTFSENLLKARSSEGKKLLEGCPDPCAYYINTAQTPMASGVTHVTMTVQCGQPRRDSVFSAVYSYEGAIVHQWACSAAHNQ